jgi:histidine triad (HIT) family protein
MDCIFCKIINGDIPSYKIYEDENVLAFLDITQGTKGHTLVIPKKHVKNVYELDEETASQLFKVVPKIANALKKAFNPIGLNIVNNNEQPLQAVFHYHLHLIPRYQEDNVVIKTDNNYGKISNDDFISRLELIRKSL